MNSLISFGNSLLYGITLSSIVRARLDPDVSFLHEPREGRFSLSLDLSEPFKPLIVMSVVRKVVNKKIITKQHFRKRNGGVYLSSKGRRKFVQAFEECLSRAVYCPMTKRNVSYRSMINFEARKLANHLLGKRKYKAFKPWW